MTGGVARSVVFVVLLLLAASPTSASPITFSGLDNPRGTLTNSLAAETQFKAALGVFGTETVDSLAGNDPTLAFGATGVTATAGGTVVATFGPVSSPQVLQDNAAVFTFNQPVQGFGTFLIDLGTLLSNTTLTFILDNTVLNTTQSVNAGTFGPNADFFNVAFFGVIDVASPFNRVTVQASSQGPGSDAVFYDNLTAGFAADAAVPEPASLLLLGTGLLAAAGAKRYRRKL